MSCTYLTQAVNAQEKAARQKQKRSMNEHLLQVKLRHSLNVWSTWTALLVSNIFSRNCVTINYGESSNTWQTDQHTLSVKRCSTNTIIMMPDILYLYLGAPGSSVSLSRLLWRWRDKHVHSPVFPDHGHPTVWKHTTWTYRMYTLPSSDYIHPQPLLLLLLQL